MSDLNNKTQDPRRELFELLRKRLGEHLSFDEFRVKFEALYNFGLQRSDLSEEEFAAVESLFNKVVWYSPFPAERAEIPYYKSEEEIEAAIRETRAELEIEEDTSEKEEPEAS